MTVLHSSPDTVLPASAGLPAKAFASGPSPYRALLVGDGDVTGADGLGTAFTEALARLTGHGVDVEAVSVAPLQQAADGDLLAGRDLSRIDAVVVVLDPEPARRTGPGTTEAVRLLLRGLGARLIAGSTLVVALPSPLAADVSPGRLDEIEAAVRETADALTPVVRLEDGAAGATSDARATGWGTAIAEATAAGLIDPMVGFLPDDHFDEDLRLDAVDRLPPRDGLWVAQFQRIVDEARAVYGTSSAALSIVDADHTRYGVTAGFEDKVVKRGQTICNRVLRTYGGLIVGDAQADLRFQRNPDVRSGDVRFYAGYRLEAADGAPLGSLCVFDPDPRDVDEEDLVRLRDLAIAAQRSIWALENGTAPA